MYMYTYLVKAPQRALFKPCFTFGSCPFRWALAVVSRVIAEFVTLSAILTSVTVTFANATFTVSSWQHTICQKISHVVFKSTLINFPLIIPIRNRRDPRDVWFFNEIVVSITSITWGTLVIFIHRVHRTNGLF